MIIKNKLSRNYEKNIATIINYLEKTNDNNKGKIEAFINEVITLYDYGFNEITYNINIININLYKTTDDIPKSIKFTFKDINIKNSYIEYNVGLEDNYSSTEISNIDNGILIIIVTIINNILNLSNIQELAEIK